MREMAIRRFRLCLALALGLSPGMASYSQDRAASRDQFFEGKVVPLAEALQKSGVKLDADAAPQWLALRTEKGKVYPLVKDDGARMFFKDARLLNRPMRLTGRLVPGSELLQVVHVHSYLKGKLHEVDYWCDICSIRAFEPGKCACCGGPMVLRELPVEDQDPKKEDVNLGDRIRKLKFTDIHYLPRTLADLGSKKAFVLAFTNTTCPLAQRYLPVLQALARDYQSKGVQFIAVNAAEEDSILAMATQAVRCEVEFPCVKDFDAACARLLGVRRTPEVVVLDGEHRLRYRGRIDDQYRLSGVRAAPTRRDLKEALDAVLAGREPAIPETEVDGCPITLPASPGSGQVTYVAVAPILQKHCGQCHQPGGGAPFSLTTYKQTAAHAEEIAEVVREGRMPPWFALHDFGPFVNRRGLTEDERRLLLDWVRSGTAPGDLGKVAPPPAPAASRWRIGEPDLVLKAATHELPAAGDIPYRFAILGHVFPEDTWVQGIQILPDNPRVLHHCNLAFGSFSKGLKEENFLTGYVPGGEAAALEDGVAFLIPKGSVLALEIHYIATGQPEKCQIAVGLRYPRHVVQKQLRNLQITTKRFAIPPGVSAYKVAASRVLDRDVVGSALFAHMHLRGKDMTFTAHLPEGQRETLLIIPNYSFSWQVPYRWPTGQQRLPRGTRLECVAHYDNSAFNPFNPDPTATVRFGQQTYQEMMYGFFFYTDAQEQLGLRVDPKTGIARKIVQARQ
jgi:mono/diheme cytochrome c family protein/thiol-disulfide isomerase/thioredoxin